jgi:hypothetical protein
MNLIYTYALLILSFIPTASSEELFISLNQHDFEKVSNKFDYLFVNKYELPKWRVAILGKLKPNVNLLNDQFNITLRDLNFSFKTQSNTKRINKVNSTISLECLNDNKIKAALIYNKNGDLFSIQTNLGSYLLECNKLIDNQCH